MDIHVVIVNSGGIIVCSNLLVSNQRFRLIMRVVTRAMVIVVGMLVSSEATKSGASSSTSDSKISRTAGDEVIMIGSLDWEAA